MRHDLYSRTALLYATVMTVGTYLGTVTATHADSALATPPASHCKWGDFGCTNPPPIVAPGNGRSSLECNKDLSTPGQCWTNCKTEEDITICDIIDLDAFWPESPTTPKVTFTGKTVTKTWRGRQIVGRLMTSES